MKLLRRSYKFEAVCKLLVTSRTDMPIKDVSPRILGWGQGHAKAFTMVGPVAYKVELSQELSSVHNTFHISNLKKFLSNESLVIPLDEIEVDDKLHFIEEPVEIMD
ncbi:hypothetical protein Tco_0160520 [Tanacetum coccineum]